MSNFVHIFPKSANVETLRDYFDWHVKNGRGQFRVEIREHYPAIPPEGDTHDERERLVFLRGVF